MIRILVLVTDGFGGFGGIAKFNRDLLTCLCMIPEVAEVVALPRIVTGDTGELPAKLSYINDSHGGKFQYIKKVSQVSWLNESFDLVICGHINLLPATLLCRVKQGGCRLLVIHGIDAWKSPKNVLVRWLAKRIDGFIAVSDFTRKKFCYWTGHDFAKGFVIPNCIEIEKFGCGSKKQPLLKRYGLESKKVIMTLGRMTASERYKGFDELLEVLPSVVKEIPAVVYLVVGDGDDRQRLEQKAKDFGVNDKVIFTGRIKEEEKADHYRLADVFAM